MEGFTVTNKLFIGGLNYETTESRLVQELLKYGMVMSIRIITKRDTGKSAGYGFVTMQTTEEAKKVIDALDNKEFDGRRIGVKESLKK